MEKQLVTTFILEEREITRKKKPRVYIKSFLFPHKIVSFFSICKPYTASRHALNSISVREILQILRKE
jgi:hypothetical protein